MNTSTLLVEAFRRIPELVHGACDGLDAAGLAYRPERGANSIAWLVWHLSRVQDDHVAEIAAMEQVWADRVWAERTGIDRDGMATGYGDTPDDVAAVVPASSEALVAYHDAVVERTMEFTIGQSSLSSAITEEMERSPSMLVGAHCRMASSSVIDSREGNLPSLRACSILYKHR